MFCKNLCDKVLRMKNTEVAIFLLFQHYLSWCTPFLGQYIFMEKIAKKSPVLNFWKKNSKKVKSTGQNGGQK